MRPTDQDLVARRPVWRALASMFLDSDVALARDGRVAVLAASPYGADELEEILIREIYPVCWGNLSAGSGEKLAFDPAWIEATLVRIDFSSLTYTRLLELARLSIPRSTEWQATLAAVAVLRGEPVENGG